MAPRGWIDLLDIRMVIVPTPRRAQATKMDRPAGVLGAKSPAMVKESLK